MEGNPYKEIVDAMDEQVSRKMLPMAATGIVTCASPLTVAVGNVVLSAVSGLLVAADLLLRTRKVKITNPENRIAVKATGTTTGTLTIETGKLEAETTITEQQGSLQTGDRVLLVTADHNIYTVICKVVSG